MYSNINELLIDGYRITGVNLNSETGDLILYTLQKEVNSVVIEFSIVVAVDFGSRLDVSDYTDQVVMVKSNGSIIEISSLEHKNFDSLIQNIVDNGK